MWTFAWMALAAAQTVLPGSSLEVTFDGDAGAEIDGALASLRSGAFEEAARRLQALVDAGGGPETHRLLALARYEAGQLALADDAVRAGLAKAPTDARLLVLDGLVKADQGRGDLALATLARAETNARGDVDLTARIEVNRALVHLDRGEPDLAEAALARAEALITKGADAELAAVIAADRAQVVALRGGTATDGLGAVGEALARGDVASAQASIPTGGGDRRSIVRRQLAEGAVARAQGRLDSARRTLEAAVATATEAGLVRERAAALASLGVVYTASNRPETARIQLEEALKLVSGSSLRVLELGYRVEAGRAALRSGDLAGAGAHLAKARALAPSTTDATSAARLAELAGMVAAGKGDVSGAASEFGAALSAHEVRRAWADAARVGCAWIEAVAGVDADETQRLVDRATAAFAAAGDPLGPAHVQNALGQGLSARHDLEGAMNAFVAAASSADEVGTDRGKQVAAIARENAARTVATEVGSAQVLKEAAKWGLQDLVQRRTRYVVASADYDAGSKAYDAKKWAEAREAFDRAVKGFESLGEPGRTTVARRSRAWSEYNATLGVPPGAAFSVWQRLVEEATLIGDAELRARARGAGALAAVDLGRPEALKSLQAAATETEQMGLRSLSGQCHAAMVKLVPTVDEKVNAGRRAFALRGGDRDGQYALYLAAYAAFQADEVDRARSLCEELLPRATGDVKAAVEELLAATQPG